ncbi:hypothetical protein D3C81_08490 [compost metagenome]
MDIRVRTNKAEIEVDKNEYGCWEPLAYFNSSKKEGWYLRSGGFFDREPVDRLTAIESFILIKYNIRYDLNGEIEKARKREAQQVAEDNIKLMVLATAKGLGKNIDATTIDWVIVQEGVGAICEVKDFFLFLDVPYMQVYAFKKDDKYMLKVYGDLLSGAKDVVWCRCRYKGKALKYVTNYRGQNHGWICPKCKRYKQIG